MLRFVLLVVLCLFSVFEPFAGCAQPVKKAIARYDYLIYLPHSYSTSQSTYPLLIYLHGGSLRGHDLNKLKAYGPPQEIANGREFPCIVVSPQCPDGKFWSTDNWFEPLYAELTDLYCIDKKRVYLTGISMGGYGAWQTAVAYPNRFAAVAPLCGGGDDSTQVCRLRNVPIWTFHGTADDLIPIDETGRLVRRLNQCNGRVTFTKLPNVGHDIQYLYGETALYDWLMKQRK